MPRKTIYIPDELDLAIRNHPGEINVSQVCAEALRAELSARESIHSVEGLLLQIFRNEKPLETKRLAARTTGRARRSPSGPVCS